MVEWNGECAQLQLTRVAGTVQSRLNSISSTLNSPQGVYEQVLPAYFLIRYHDVVVRKWGFHIPVQGLETLDGG